MHPIAFEIFGRPIYWYGIFVAVGFLMAVLNWNLLARREGLPKGFGSEVGFWVMVSGLIGARLAYVAANLDYYLARPAEIIRFDRGGLIFYGGLIGGFVGVLLYARRHRRPVLWMGDFTLTGLILGHAFGRVGCFLNGCCFGGPHAGWPHVSFPPDSAASVQQAQEGLLAYAGLPSLYVHPTQLYETTFNLLVYALMIFLFLRPGRRNGQVAALYLMLYPVGRFFIEFTRGDVREMWLGLHIAQDVSIALFLCGTALWFYVQRSTTGDASSPKHVES